MVLNFQTKIIHVHLSFFDNACSLREANNLGKNWLHILMVDIFQIQNPCLRDKWFNKSRHAYISSSKLVTSQFQVFASLQATSKLMSSNARQYCDSHMSSSQSRHGIRLRCKQNIQIDGIWNSITGWQIITHCKVAKENQTSVTKTWNKQLKLKDASCNSW